MQPTYNEFESSFFVKNPTQGLLSTLGCLGSVTLKEMSELTIGN